MPAPRKLFTALVLTAWFGLRDVAVAAELKTLPIGELASNLYSFSLKIVGLAVFVMFLLAGLTYIVPGLEKAYGKPTAIVKDAVIGLIILASAYIILNSISPDLVGTK